MAKRIFLLAVTFSLASVFMGLLHAQTESHSKAATPALTAMYGEVAYVNSIELLEAIPEKVAATKAIAELNQKYKDELGVMQSDYNKKYSDFMTYQESMSESIKLRRMQELFELEKNINAFMVVAQEDIESQEQQQIEPLRQKVKEAIEAVGIENNFVCIYDLANPAIAFVTPKAVNATALVKAKLGVRR
ncbi:outer membrane protein [Dysgonomonas sp. PH5-45]|uniref:OmpH family outer membrane protein n=1 Tax=unclassified Dysgonomonas TaxID=2630389 RepID=UPI00247326FF|nr:MULTISPECIES: OmpH family outer membrane protein [unclassified Dysgonomonas]MDH6353864.1 outer membrane protein [Dysgonomonas sp. PH5-45]MDH6386767.1 outer membrane protein [Dysgonomonas sp. PH5-37]